MSWTSSANYPRPRRSRCRGITGTPSRPSPVTCKPPPNRPGQPRRNHGNPLPTGPPSHGDPFPRTPGSAGITGNLPTPSPRHMGLRPTPPGHPSQPALRETACHGPVNSVQRPSHIRLNALSTPPDAYQHVHRLVNDLSTARGKSWEGLPETSPGGLATSWPGGCPVVQCQSRGAGCRCTGVQWSRSAQVLIRTRAHLTFRFYFHPRTAIFRLQNAPCLRQTCPLRFKTPSGGVQDESRARNRSSESRASDRTRGPPRPWRAGRPKNFQFSSPLPRQAPDKYPASTRQAVPSLRGRYLLYFVLPGVGVLPMPGEIF